MTASSKNPSLDSWLHQAAAQLQTVGIQSSRLDAELLASHVFSQPRTWLHAHHEHQLSLSEHQKLNRLLDRRFQHEPIAYIIGSKEFFGYTFRVNRDVLIPRPESEDMIAFVRKLDESYSCIDIGTGSGALAICAQLEQPTWTVTASDISPAALRVARTNAQKLGTPKVVFTKQNLLANDHNHYDVLLANLPYVPQKLFNKPDIAHEPPMALFAGADGLDTYRDLFHQLTSRNQKPTHLITESLKVQHNTLKQFAADAGYRLKETSGLIQYFTMG